MAYDKNYSENVVTQIENGDIVGGLTSAARDTENRDRFDAYVSTLIQQLNRDEDFRRSTPQAQIQRLMAAGLSRAQAIKALTGEQYSQVSPEIAGNVEQSDIDRMNAISNIVSQSLSFMEQAFALGTQIAMSPAAIKQAKASAQIAQQNAAFSQLQLDASNQVGLFAQAMYNWHEYTGNDYPSSVDEMIKVMKSVSESDMPDVYALGNTSFKNAMQNPYFYPALKSMYRNIYMDKADLAAEYERTLASSNLAKIDVNRALADASRAWSDFRVNFATERDRIERESYATSIAGSQAALERNNALVSNIDTAFWSQFDGKSRISYLNNQTREQAYQTALLKLKVDEQEQLNEATALEVFQKFKVAENLGDDYYHSVADEMMRNSNYRNVVLQLALIQGQSALEFRNVTDALGESGTNIPGVNLMYNVLRPIADYFKSYGVLDAAIKYGAEAAGFLSKMPK